jgi:mannose-6-phosphate isomerase-like protein (cupin superfamily)
MPNGRGVLQTDAGGANIRVRLSGKDSEGELAVIEEVLEADFEGPPLHVHASFGEGFYILEGELSFQMEEETVSGGPATFVFAPRGVPHTFANLSGDCPNLALYRTVR